MFCKTSRNVRGTEYPFSTAAILRDSPGTRQVTVERHEGQLEKETPSPPSRRLAKAASMSLLGNRQSHTPQFASLLASRACQTTAERDGGRSQQEIRVPSPHRLAKAASMSLLSSRPQFGSLLALVTSQMTPEKNEGQLQQETRPPSFHRLAKAASMSALGDRQLPTTQFGSLLASGTGQMMAEIHEERLQQVSRSPSSRRLAKAASMSALGNRQSSKSIQFGSLLYVGTSQVTAEKHEGRPRRASVLNFIQG
jgi:hypothetical protein